MIAKDDGEWMIVRGKNTEQNSDDFKDDEPDDDWELDIDEKAALAKLDDELIKRTKARMRKLQFTGILGYWRKAITSCLRKIKILEESKFFTTNQYGQYVVEAKPWIALLDTETYQVIANYINDYMNYSRY